MKTEEGERADSGPSGAPGGSADRFWPRGWWKLMDFRIGIVPLPVYLLLLGIMIWLVRLHKVPGEICMVIAIMVVGGFTCAEIGNRLPVLRNIGGAAILATFVPSCLAYYHIVPSSLLKPVADFLKSTNFLYLFITAIIVGSILSMDRQVLIKGFLKIFVPLAAGSLAAALVGTAVGTMLGLGARHTLFFIIAPIMAGGVGEGAIPLSVGYAERLHQSQSEIFALVLPPVMLGSLMAILLAGMLNFVGKRYPHLTGEGRLQPGEDEDENTKQDRLHAPAGAIEDKNAPLSASERGGGEVSPLPQRGRGGYPLGAGEGNLQDRKPEGRAGMLDVSHIAAAGIMAISLYLVGVLCHELFDWPAPIAMLALAVLVKLLRAASPPLQEGARFVYSFFRVAVVYPLLFAVGAAMTPWDKLISAFHPANLATIFATVATLMTTGFVVGRWLGMYPIETAIINGTHSGQGGTGDIAILTAANRMTLLPFAQVATRIGGAITVTLALIALSRMK